MSETRDFWLSCGHHLLDRGEDGGLVVTDEFLKAYLARPEMLPPEDACAAERALHQALLADPRRPVEPGQIEAIADADARENWELMIDWRDHLVGYATLESAYLAIVRHERKFPRIFLDQLVQVILRNILDDCEDVFVLRAAELLFRSQRLTSHEGSLVAVDEEAVPGSNAKPLAPLVAMLGLSAATEVDVLNEDNAGLYWERSDSFDMGLDLTAGRRGLAALGVVVTRWVRHLLAVDVKIDPVTELRDVNLTWYVGLDADATRIGDALWNGDELDQTARGLVVGLYRLTFADDVEIIEPARGAPTYMIAAMSIDKTLRLKPQNLVSGLPVLHRTGALN
ncbi:MAG TPA: DUF6352 family protein [Steroidobacteraceae bacterium]|jgi:hypothetical protein|nr:DUF6352 family protein [Steroidobacteraceae bacterium]